MLNYIKMKRNQWKVRAALYGAAATIIDDRKEILELLQKMYAALKDVPPEELREELVSRLAELIHNN
ncbi:MAG: hypothetical protein K2P59_06475 [Acetatifactor sp.]|nr:hypothetical protein [Acetatifactor sp.]